MYRGRRTRRPSTATFFAVAPLVMGSFGRDQMGMCVRALARLMDAGKCLSVKVVGKELEDHWLDITIAVEMKEA